MRRLVQTLLVLCLLAGAAFAQTRTIGGTLRYDDRKWSQSGVTGMTSPVGSWRPIRNVEVRIRVTPSGVERVVQTSSAGFFTTTVPAAQAGIGSQVTITFEASNFAVDVFLDNDDPSPSKLTWTRVKSVTTASGGITVNATVSASSVAAHFNIADCILRGRNYADVRRGDDDDICSAEVDYPDETWNHFNEVNENIYISGPEIAGEGGYENGDWGYNDETILHEYGHALMFDISDDDVDFPHSHEGHIGYGYDFAWSEGWPTYFANAVRLKNASHWNENAAFWGFDAIEPIPTYPSGTSYADLDSEKMTSSCLYDLVDGIDTTKESFDRMRDFHTTLFKIFDYEMDEGEDVAGNDIDRDILGFHQAFVGRWNVPQDHAKLDRIMAAHGLCPHALEDYRVASVSASTMSAVTDQWVNVTIRVERELRLYNNVPARVRLRMFRILSGGVVQEWHLGDFDVTMPAEPANGVATGQRTVSVRMPWQLPTGTYKLQARVDPEDERTERNNYNNHRTLTGFHLENPMGDFNPGFEGQDGSGDTESNDSSDVH